MADLKGKTAVVTGASEGIGAAVARELARASVKVGLLARTEEKLEAVAESVQHAGGGAIVLPADVTRRDEVDRAMERFLSEFGPPDIVVANAGVGVFVSARKQNAQTVLNMMDVNYKGTVHVVEAVLPSMIERRAGHVVVTSSLASTRALPGFGAYSASKAAVERYIEGLRLELGPVGIHFTLVRPGFVRTAMTARNRFYMPLLMGPEEVAAQVLRAIRKKQTRAAFPWPMALATEFASLLPDAVYDRLIRFLYSGVRR